jgi:hypothetical protein
VRHVAEDVHHVLDGWSNGKLSRNELRGDQQRCPRSRLRASVKVRDQVSHPLRRDSGRSSNRNRHLSPSVNTSRLSLQIAVRWHRNISGLPTNRELLTQPPRRTSMILWGFCAQGQVWRQRGDLLGAGPRTRAARGRRPRLSDGTTRLEMTAEIVYLDFISRIGQRGVFDPHAFEPALGFGTRLRIGIVRQLDHNGIGRRANFCQGTDR